MLNALSNLSLLLMLIGRKAHTATLKTELRDLVFSTKLRMVILSRVASPYILLRPHMTSCVDYFFFPFLFLSSSSFPFSLPPPPLPFSPIYSHASSLCRSIITYPVVHASPHRSYFRYLPCYARISSPLPYVSSHPLCMSHCLEHMCTTTPFMPVS
jgi:hypothetical protein